MNQALAAREEELVEAETAAQLEAERIDVTALPSRTRRGAASDLAPAGAGRRPLRRHGLGDRRRSRARARVVQLRRAELRRRPPGARRCRTRSSSIRSSAHLVMRTHTSPVQVRSMLEREVPIYVLVPGPRVPHRRVRRDAPARLHAVRGHRRRQGHHDGAPEGHARPRREVALRRRGEDPLPRELLPLHRAVAPSSTSGTRPSRAARAGSSGAAAA